MVVSSDGYLDTVTTLAIVVPVSTVDRAWPNHILLHGVPEMDRSYAMTEQPRTVSRERLGDRIGHIDGRTLADIRQWLGDFLDIA